MKVAAYIKYGEQVGDHPWRNSTNTCIFYDKITIVQITKVIGQKDVSDYSISNIEEAKDELLQNSSKA